MRLKPVSAIYFFGQSQMSKATRVGSAANLGHVLAACHDRQPGGRGIREGRWGRAASPTSRFLRATLGHDGGEEGGNRSGTDRKRPRAGARGRTTNHFLALAIAWWEAAQRRGLAFSFGDGVSSMAGWRGF